MNKISPGALILGMFGVLLSLLAAFAVKQYVTDGEPVATPVTPPRLTDVPLAIGDLEPGRTVTEGDLMVVRLSPEELRGAELPDMFVNRSSDIIGRTLRTALAKGAAFEPDVFYPEGMGPGVGELLQPGLRALTVTFDSAATRSGMISSGMSIDVLFRSEADEERRVPEATMTLLEDVEVLAVDGQMQKGLIPEASRTAGQTLTLAVNTRQAQALKTVEGKGTLTPVVRNRDDELSLDGAEPLTLDGLLGIAEPPPLEPTPVLEIYRRGRLSVVSWEQDQRQPSQVLRPGLPIAGTKPSVSDSGLSAVDQP